jgi:hypothetical protein
MKHRYFKTLEISKGSTHIGQGYNLDTAKYVSRNKINIFEFC